MGLWDVVEDVGEAVGEAAGDVVDAVGDAAEAVGDAVDDAVDAIGDAVDEVGDAIEDAVDAVGDAVGDAVDAIADAVEEAAAEVAEAAEDIWDHVTDIAEDAWEAASEAAEDAWETVADAAEDAWDAIAEAVEDAWEAVAEAAEDVWEAASEAAEATWEAAADAAEEVGEAVAQAYESAVDAAEAAVEWVGDRIVDLGQLLLQLGACLAGQVVYQLAKSGNVLANFWKPPRPLPEPFRGEMEALFDTGLGNVFFVDDASLTANWFVEGQPTDGMTFAQVTLAGFTLTNVIFVADPWDPTDATDRQLMAHELVHVLQYRRLITEPAFACAYGIGFAEAGFDYRANPFEDDAYDFVAAHTADIVP